MYAQGIPRDPWSFRRILGAFPEIPRHLQGSPFGHQRSQKHPAVGTCLEIPGHPRDPQGSPGDPKSTDQNLLATEWRVRPLRGEGLLSSQTLFR